MQSSPKQFTCNLNQASSLKCQLRLSQACLLTMVTSTPTKIPRTAASLNSFSLTQRMYRTDHWKASSKSSKTRKTFALCLAVSTRKPRASKLTTEFKNFDGSIKRCLFFEVSWTACTARLRNLSFEAYLCWLHGN